MIGPTAKRRSRSFRARGRHARRGRVRAAYAWAVLAVAVVLLVVAGEVGWLMRSVLVDVVSLWPGWLVTITPVLIRRRMLRHHLRAIGSGPGVAPPLLLLGWVVVGLALHLGGWDVLPSSAGHLAGPAVGGDITSAVLDIQLEGEVVLDGAAGPLYEVSPMRTGGNIAPARASEVLADRDMTVRLREGPEPGWFGSSGWRVSVSSSPRWEITVLATSLDADLTMVRVDFLRVASGGRVRLGAPSGDVPVRVGGELVLAVPSDASVEVVGPVRVGPGWEVTAGGKRYVGGGASRYLVEVDPGSDLVVEQWQPNAEQG